MNISRLESCDVHDCLDVYHHGSGYVPDRQVDHFGHVADHLVSHYVEALCHRYVTGHAVYRLAVPIFR